ncbi:MAG: methylenetetrahydrofolate--tRNA-(uracil(54)-C(5))-methyltransferase (FADH(2)-oxidizing) TrmFO [Oscillospiraceae bacterium]|nr:methylenetetrahydrofolate--tRNA-(uracil(54)-C(5))-methyltransferase (FADH(2)-oxidizing) TrmFO [Oscillospiraceae bacterium]MDD6083134.1 methylenetetrahydrofolate--tRNA-(uracil(54)-C(5))-methyltransferase (FADH(2)-oxidizing) TrmFO [Oscillospiraceae bacterium]
MAVKVIGAGLAGCEAAWQLANAGIEVELYEMKPKKFTPAHHYDGMAELVCSNSLKASRVDSACGLLKEEMRLLGSLIVPCAVETQVEAGGALAVDRTKFSDLVTEKIKSHPLINVISEEVCAVPEGNVIIATGPLTSGALAESISEKCGSYLSFFDAAAPIVTYDSLDKDVVFFASRYDKGDADYINCPMNREEYELFYNELINAESAPLKEFDRESFKVYEGCMPIEVLAKRGEDTMRFGPLKPVGLTDKRTGKRPYAVVQLRKENREGTMYNLVGFQTNLKFGEQKRVFSLIPGLKDAEFVRYGVMHRNSFINSPLLLKPTFEMRECPGIFFAGQITGVEGYVESAASGIIAGINMANKLQGKPEFIMPPETMTGALAAYISDIYNKDNFQPMGSNMGILPELPERIKDKKKKYQMYADRALEKLGELI